jgi:hypothetical protein
MIRGNKVIKRDGSRIIRAIPEEGTGYFNPPEGVNAMKCPRCEGYMWIERFADYYLTFYAGRCLNCGAIVDETILSNKGIPSEPAPAMTIKQS